MQRQQQQHPTAKTPNNFTTELWHNVRPRDDGLHGRCRFPTTLNVQYISCCWWACCCWFRCIRSVNVLGRLLSVIFSRFVVALAIECVYWWEYVCMCVWLCISDAHHHHSLASHSSSSSKHLYFVYVSWQTHLTHPHLAKLVFLLLHFISSAHTLEHTRLHSSPVHAQNTHIPIHTHPTHNLSIEVLYSLIYNWYTRRAYLGPQPSHQQQSNRCVVFWVFTVESMVLGLVGWFVDEADGGHPHLECEWAAKSSHTRQRLHTERSQAYAQRPSYTSPNQTPWPSSGHPNSRSRVWL